MFNRRPRLVAHDATTPRWYPHLCYAGEPMAKGQFREPQPTAAGEIMRHNAAIAAIEQFCTVRNVPVPPLNEEITYEGGRKRRLFVGHLEGRRFGIGYEVANDGK